MKIRVLALILACMVSSMFASAQSISWISNGGDENWEFTIESETNSARLRDIANGRRILIDLENALELSEYIRSFLVRIDEDDQNFELRDAPTHFVTYRKGADLVTRKFIPLHLRPPSIIFRNGPSSDKMIEIDEEIRTGIDRLLLTNLSAEILKVFQRLDEAGLNKLNESSKEQGSEQAVPPKSDRAGG